MDMNELRIWRKARGLKQLDLAKMLGVRRETVVNWEKGRHAVPPKILAKLEAATPEGLVAKVMAAPAVKPYARWRPYPWGNRDYMGTELDRLRPGAMVWRLLTDDTQWELRMCFGKMGHFVSGEPYGLTLPAEAFPDPAGAEASWAKEMHDQRKALAEAKSRGLRDFREALGVPPDEESEK